MTGSLGLGEAELLLVKHLSDTPRATHSRFVGAVMRALAASCGAETELWAVVGLVHDLDYPATIDMPDRHGVLVTEWLAGRLPAEALAAIASHDHRSGVTSALPISDALKLADAVAVLDEAVGRVALLRALAAGPDAVRTVAGDRPYLADMILEFGARLGAGLPDLAEILRWLPVQAGRMTP